MFSKRRHASTVYSAIVYERGKLQQKIPKKAERKIIQEVFGEQLTAMTQQETFIYEQQEFIPVIQDTKVTVLLFATFAQKTTKRGVL